MTEGVGDLWRTLDDLKAAIATKSGEVEALRGRLEAAEEELRELRRLQVRFWDLAAKERAGKPGRMRASSVSELPAPIPVLESLASPPDETPSTAPNMARNQATPATAGVASRPDSVVPKDLALGHAATPVADRAGRSAIHYLQAMDWAGFDDRVDDRFHGMTPTDDGQAPKGFAAAVRQVAHRSLLLAGRPLRRTEILVEVERSGIPLPEKNVLMKISKVLSRDPDLVNKGRKGYVLREWGRLQQERALRERAADPVPKGDAT